MRIRTYLRATFVKFLLIGLFILPACSAPAPFTQSTVVAATIAPTTKTKPDWFNIKMTDVRTGQTFSMSDFSGKVVLLETMSAWCGTCLLQQREVKKLEGLTGNSKDLIHVSLDTDFNEDASTLKEYIDTYSFDWYFAVSPLEVDRALGNLYSAEFMNPPLAPMLIIDRQGGVDSLPWGLKGAVSLQKTLAPYLAQ